MKCFTHYITAGFAKLGFVGEKKQEQKQKKKQQGVEQNRITFQCENVTTDIREHVNTVVKLLKSQKHKKA